MSNNRITQDQLEPNVMEELESGIGDLSTLSTENKDSLVAAVTEIYGKNVIAEAIGEPLAVTDTFSEMGSEINSLLSSFKTNMMNSGVTVESGDKFKALIDKIQGLTEGEGNKGVQFVEGVINTISESTKTFTATKIIGGSAGVKNLYYNTIELNFEPYVLFTETIVESYNSGGNLAATFVINNFYNSFSDELTVSHISQYQESLSKAYYNLEYEGNVYYNPIIDTLTAGVSRHVMKETKYYAIGVGEEDTTLRDSLASILQEEGVNVTEEDDMASLITKVDEEFDNKNITDFSMGTQKLTWTVYSNEWIELSLNHSCGKIPKLVSIGFFDYKTELSNKYHTDENNYAVHKPTGLTNIYHFYISSITNDTIFLKMRYSNFDAGSSTHGVTAHYVLVY